MPVLVIGPSGVGKSSALGYAKELFNACRFVNLDDLARDTARERGLIGDSDGINTLRQKLGDDEAFLRLGISAVEQLDRQASTLLVVDVGAGFLDASSVGGWLRRHTSVALLAPPEVVHRRIVQARADARSLAGYAAQEYSVRRLALYEQATHTVNADCTADELGLRLLTLLRSAVAAKVNRPGN